MTGTSRITQADGARLMYAAEKWVEAVREWHRGSISPRANVTDCKKAFAELIAQLVVDETEGW